MRSKPLYSSSRWQDWKHSVPYIYRWYLRLGICLSVELSTGISCIRAILCHLTSISEPSTQVFVVAAVILAISLNLPSIVVTAFDVQSQMCSENFPSYTFSRAYYITWSFCNSVIPICIMGCLYSSIILHLQKQTFIPDSSRVSATRRRNKVTKMLISVTVIFAVCWIPQATLCVISPIIPDGYGTVSAVATCSISGALTNEWKV